MGLYRIILVDDEEEVRKGIIRKINWNQLGFEVVGDAENGQDALEKIEQLEPDLVMTDIRMPYMDGLTLAERIRQKYPSIKILIFSGFDDFEYAQQAIKLNVTEYILKPVNVEELTKILLRVSANLDEEIAQRRDVDLLRKSYLDSLPILRELFLNDLVRGTVDALTIEEKLKEYDIDILGAKKWVSAIIYVEDTERENQEKGELAGNGQRQERSGEELKKHRELIPISVRGIVEDHLKQYCRFVVFNSLSGITLIAAVDEDNTQTGFIDLLSDICKETKRILGVGVTIAVGHGCTCMEQIGKSYKSAVDALGYKAIVGTGKTIYINDVEPVNRGKLQLDGRSEADLISAIKFGSKEKIAAVMNELIEKMGDAKVHMRQHQLYMLSMVNCITQLMQQYDLAPGEILQAGDSNVDILSAIQNPENFESWILQAAYRVNEQVNKERDNTAKKVIMEAKEYIQEHYQNPDLSVEMICRQLHMSPAYFSTVFKKETGQTYIAYLTEVRLSKAVELLNETDDKTYVIAQRVGYQEQNYFSYVFKKRFGISPTKFRSAKQM